MMTFELKLSIRQFEKLCEAREKAYGRGSLDEINRINSVLSAASGHTAHDIASILRIGLTTVYDSIKKYLENRINGLFNKKRAGRPAKLTKTQRKALGKMIDAGPEVHGFSGSCWRTPMIQELIFQTFGVFYAARYISELLDALGFSYQKAKFVAANQDKEARAAWLNEVWPEILKKANKRNAYVLFGDECSFPQWGTLSYTWSRKGQQPIVKTSGTRRGYKVFGLIDYFTGKFFSKGYVGQLNAESYIEFLTEVLVKTRKPIILIQDGAPYHRSKLMKAFFEQHEDRLTVYRLPSYSPDYNPIEQLWKKIKQHGTHLKYFPTFECLTDKVEEMLVKFANIKREVLSLFGFYNELESA